MKFKFSYSTASNKMILSHFFFLKKKKKTNLGSDLILGSAGLSQYYN